MNFKNVLKTSSVTILDFLKTSIFFLKTSNNAMD